MTRRCSGCGQHGIVLVVVLVLIGVMAVTAALAMRLALTGEAVGGARHAQAQAFQAAEAALRWCEAQLAAPTPAVTALAPPASGDEPAQWADRVNWTGSAPVAATAPAALAGEGVEGAWADAPGQCLIEEMELRRLRGADDRLRAFVVTARGTSPGFVDGVTGGEVWLQSVVRR